MTVRLVALMSVVLLLSLAAFGLMMNHYQDQVMEEVARTASEVGRATLRTLEFADVTVEHLPADSPVALWHQQSVDVTDSSGSTEALVKRRTVREPGPEGASEDEDKAVVRVIASSVRSHEQVGETALVFCETNEETGEEECVSGSGDSEMANRFLIKIDDIHAEPDPAQGLVLRIPRFAPAEATHDVRAILGSGPGTFTRQEEILLPIPVEDYDDLFDSVRRRSLWLFLGVFVVGTVLSGGLAMRFTRPVRRLDRAIRRLSGGDLEVRVETRGKDEVARLGRAFNDMTRSLRASRERSREVVRREKHSALGRLAAGVAHDIRNPLHSIGLTLQHLSEACRPEAPDRGNEFDRSVEIIRGEIRRLDRLVGNFLQFAKSDVRPRTGVDLGELLQETERLVRKEAEWRGISIELSLHDAVPIVEVDGEAMRSSILNLVLNSFEAMPDGGRLELSLSRQDDAAIVRVADSGRGIPPGDQDRVFDFAYTTREGGNGLGLAMVYQCVVEEHGGRVWLDSTPGRGTSVYLAIPLPATEQELVS